MRRIQNIKAGAAEAGNRQGRGPRAEAFTLLEVMMALAILALTTSSVLTIINRCMASTANCALRMEAFQVARENMEKVLAADSVSESVEYGTSELYPDVSWRTVVEAFSEPKTGQMWARGVCSAEYADSTGETQTLELVHWIGPLTDQQADQLLQEEDLETLAAEQLVESVEEAAEHAGVDVETLEDWVQNGLLTTEDGFFIRYNLDLYVQSGGNPSEEDRDRQVGSIEELAAALKAEREAGEGASGALQGADGTDPATGLPYEGREQMGAGEGMELQDRGRPAR